MRRAVLPVVLLGLGLAGCGPRSDAAAAPDGAVAMAQDQFSAQTREIPVGERITFSNAGSRTIHVLVLGKDGRAQSVPDAPSFGSGSRHRSDLGDRWTTPPWTTPGTFHVTCTLHPAMNLTVVVGRS